MADFFGTYFKDVAIRPEFRIWGSYTGLNITFYSNFFIFFDWKWFHNILVVWSLNIWAKYGLSRSRQKRLIYPKAPSHDSVATLRFDAKRFRRKKRSPFHLHFCYWRCIIFHPSYIKYIREILLVQKTDWYQCELIDDSIWVLGYESAHPPYADVWKTWTWHVKRFVE